MGFLCHEETSCGMLSCKLFDALNYFSPGAFFVQLLPRRVPGIVWRAKSAAVHLHHGGELVNCLAANGIEGGN